MTADTSVQQLAPKVYGWLAWRRARTAHSWWRRPARTSARISLSTLGDALKTIFAIIGAEPTQAIERAIKAKFPDDYLEVGTGQWLVADEGTSVSVTQKLGLADKDHPTGSALVLAVSSYYGRKGPVVWEWIRSKWGSA